MSRKGISLEIRCSLQLVRLSKVASYNIFSSAVRIRISLDDFLSSSFIVFNRRQSPDIIFCAEARPENIFVIFKFLYTMLSSRLLKNHEKNALFDIWSIWCSSISSAKRFGLHLAIFFDGANGFCFSAYSSLKEFLKPRNCGVSRFSIPVSRYLYSSFHIFSTVKIFQVSFRITEKFSFNKAPKNIFDSSKIVYSCRLGVDVRMYFLGRHLANANLPTNLESISISSWQTIVDKAQVLHDVWTA